METANVVANIVIASATVVALVFAILEYLRAKHHRAETNRPYVIVELERVASSLLNISIRNIGLESAKNIRVKFKPNFQPYTSIKTKINDLAFLKNLRFLPPGKNLAFFFGSAMGKESIIRRRFDVSIEYENVSGKKYQENFIIDRRDFLELMNVNRHDIHDVAAQLEKIAGKLSDTSQATKAIEESIRVDGIRIRNSHTTGLQIDDILRIIVHLANSDHQANFRPHVHDLRLLVRQARDTLLNTKHKNKTKILDHLDWLIDNDWDHYADETNNRFDKLTKLTTARPR